VGCFDDKCCAPLFAGGFSWSQCSITPQNFVRIAAKIGAHHNKKTREIAVYWVQFRSKTVGMCTYRNIHPTPQECDSCLAAKFWEVMLHDRFVTTRMLLRKHDSLY
jgi:hypothetical protein